MFPSFVSFSFIPDSPFHTFTSLFHSSFILSFLISSFIFFHTFFLPFFPPRFLSLSPFTTLFSSFLSFRSSLFAFLPLPFFCHPSRVHPFFTLLLFSSFLSFLLFSLLLSPLIFFSFHQSSTIVCSLSFFQLSFVLAFFSSRSLKLIRFPESLRFKPSHCDAL